MYSKVDGLPDAPITEPNLPYQDGSKHFLNGPRIHEYHMEMHKYILGQVDDGREVMTVGEAGFSQDSVFKDYTSAAQGEINVLFNFEHVCLGMGSIRYDLSLFNSKDFKLAVYDSFRFINRTDCWSTVYLENHDQPRSISRFGNDSSEWRVISGKLLSLLEISLTGTLYVYQGQELGQIIFKGWTIDQYEDIDCFGNYKMIKEKFGENSKAVKRFYEGIALVSRDHARNPFPWSNEEPFAGFTDSDKPRFGLNESFKDGINATEELKDSNSVFHFWRKALQVRKEHKEILVYGYDFEFHDLDNERLFVFTKKSKNKTLFAALNFSDAKVEFTTPVREASYTPFFGNYKGVETDSRILQPYEGRFYYFE